MLKKAYYFIFVLFLIFIAFLLVKMLGYICGENIAWLSEGAGDVVLFFLWACHILGIIYFTVFLWYTMLLFCIEVWFDWFVRSELDGIDDEDMLFAKKSYVYSVLFSIMRFWGNNKEV